MLAEAHDSGVVGRIFRRLGQLGHGVDVGNGQPLGPPDRFLHAAHAVLAQGRGQVVAALGIADPLAAAAAEGRCDVLA